MQIVEVIGNVTKGEGLWLPYIMGTRSLTSSNEVTQFHLYCVINRVAVFFLFCGGKIEISECYFQITLPPYRGQRSTIGDKQHVEIGPQKSSVSFTQKVCVDL